MKARRQDAAGGDPWRTAPLSRFSAALLLPFPPPRPLRSAPNRNHSRAFSGELTPRDLVPPRKSPPLRAGRRGGEPRIKGLFRGHWATVLLTLLTFSVLARERDRVAGVGRQDGFELARIACPILRKTRPA